MDFQDFFNDLVESAEEESPQGGAIIGEVQFATAYKTFEAGIPLIDSLHLVKNIKDRASAKASAEEQKVHNRISYGFAMIVKKEGAVNRNGEPFENWNGDRAFFTQLGQIRGEFTAAAQLTLDKIQELKLALPQTSWAEISFIPDPWEGEDGKRNTETYENRETGETEERVKLVPVPTVLFASEAEAKDGKVSSDSAFVGNIPEGWTTENWPPQIPKIKALLAGGEQTPADIAGAYGVTPADIIALG